jgi:predicted house-cleaning noncanonical NTP pyrophosphatase (MazG superfamily)
LTEGKLVRDLIPAIIRESGRHAEVRYLSGTELASALGAKLCEEAHEARDAADYRESLIEELADLTEVMSALMALRGIEQYEVLDAAEKKAALHGRFTTGTWLTSTD